jgi:hypothetical protein
MTRRKLLAGLAPVAAVAALAAGAAGVHPTAASFLDSYAETHTVNIDSPANWVVIQGAHDPLTIPVAPATGEPAAGDDTVVVRTHTKLPEGSSSVRVRVSVPAGSGVRLHVDGIDGWSESAEFPLDADASRGVTLRAQDGPARPVTLTTELAPHDEDYWLQATTTATVQP